MLRYRMAAAFVACVCAACGSPKTSQPATPQQSLDEQVRVLADEYLAGFFEHTPELVTYNGVPGRRHDKLFDNSLTAQKAWEAREDVWVAKIRQLDPRRIERAPLRATYAIVRQALEGSIAKRLCRDELWNVSQMTGWQVNYGYLVTIQPVGNADARHDALARWSALPKYLDTEIENLREGIKSRYTAPKLNVRIVIDQVRTLAATTMKDSPFGSPIQRDNDAEFKKAFATLVTAQIVPAARRYADFLEQEYLPAAREATPVSANSNGAACYDASVLYHSSSPKSAKQAHELGLQQIANIDAEMKSIGAHSFHNGDVSKLLQQLRSDRKYKFRTRDEKIAYSQAALARAKAAIPSWFGLLPKADVVIQPYPKYREKNAPNEYNPPAEDGSRPAVFFISAYQADRQSRVEDESTAFHETIPGHHLQGAIALERKDIHPIGRYLYNSGYAEGWALYAERLADEIGLFSSDLDRMGMLSSQALRAARLVVDTGLHTMDWTREQAIAYMLAHTAEGEHDVASEVDRYIIYPGQATAYMIGRVEIDAARAEAKQALGSNFDIKAFHDRILEDGGVPLTFLREKIRAWSAVR